jgi:hypothetical protein
MHGASMAPAQCVSIRGGFLRSIKNGTAEHIAAVDTHRFEFTQTWGAILDCAREIDISRECIFTIAA